MAENNLVALRVSLGMDSAQFTQSVTDINRRLKAVKSEFEAVSDGTNDFAQSVDGLRAKNDMLNRQMDLQKAKLTEIKRKYDESVRTKGEDDKATQNLLIRYNKTLGAMNKTESQIHKVNDALNDHSDKARRAQDGLQNFGDKAQGIGGMLSVTLSPAIAGIGVGLLKVADDAEGSTARLQRTFGTTKEEAEELSGVARDLWKKGFGEGLEDVEDSLIQVKQNLKGLNDGELEEVTKNAMYLADTFDSEVNEVTRAGNNLMENFGLESEKAFDLMAWGAQNGLNFSNEMFDNLSEYSGLFADMGFSAEEYFQLLQKGSESGVYNLDFINDAMKEFQIRVKDGSKGTSDAMGQMSKSTQQVWKDFNAGKGTVKDVHNAVIKELKGMDDQTKANNIGVGLYGTKWEDLEADAMYAMGGIEGGLENLDGAMARSGDAVEKTFSEKVQIAWREAQDELVPLGEKLLEIAEDVLPKVTGAIDDMVGWWDKLSPGMKDFALILGGVALVAPPIIMAVGGIASAIGGMMPIITGITGAIGAAGLTGTLVGLAAPVGIAVGALAVLGLGYVALDKEMDKPIIKSDIFAGKISESTKKAVGSYMKLDEDATAELNSLAWSSETITQAMANDMVAKYQTMGNQVLNAMKENHNKQYAEQERFFAESDILTAEEEAKRLAKLKADQLAEEEAHTKNQARIKEIWNLAVKEKRGITDAEAKEIAKLQEGMRTKAVQELSKSQQEQETILKNLKTNKGIIEAETAANTVKKSVETKDKVIADAEKEYKDKVANAKSARDDLGIISDEEATAIIEEAERKKKETVTKAEDMHTEVVKEAKNQAKEHVNQVDWETGEVLTGWDTMYNGVISAVSWIRQLFGKDKVEKSGNVRNAMRKGVGIGLKTVLPGHAKGTPNGQYAEGLSIVSEEGRELIHEPGVGVYLSGDNGSEIRNFRPGTSVLPNKDTEKLLKKHGFPGYADGIGDYFDVFTKGSGAVWDLLKDKFKLKDFTSILDSHTGSPLNYVGNMATDWIKGLWDDFFGGDFGSSIGTPSGKGVARWRSTILQAAAAMGESITSAELNGILAQIQRESGGNEKIIQSSAVWDINTASGNPARGLLQYIPQTFNAYKVKGHNNIYSGYDQLLAFFNNKTWRRDLPYGRRGWGPRGGRKYEKGGFITSEHMALVGEGGKKEVIIPLEQYSARAKELWKQAGIELGMLKAPQPEQYQNVATMQNAGTTSTTNNANRHYNITVNSRTADLNESELMRTLQRMEVLYG